MNKKIKLSLLAFTLITNAYSQDIFPSTTQNSDIEINNKLLESGSSVISNNGSINVTNNSIIKGDLTAHKDININNSTIDSGAHNIYSETNKTINIQNSTLNGGNFFIYTSFNGNNYTVNNTINISNGSKINDGKFSIQFEKIWDGLLNINNIDIINGGKFEVERIKISNTDKINGGNFSTELLEMNQNIINNGNFSSHDAIIENSTINNGKFNITNSIINTSIIKGGTFINSNNNIKGTKINSSTIENGLFSGLTTIENNSIVNDGIFNGDLTIKNNSIVNGGDFNNLSSVYFDSVDINNKLNFTADSFISVDNSNLGENITFNPKNNTNIYIKDSTLSSEFKEKYNELYIGTSNINTIINANIFYTNSLYDLNSYNIVNKIVITKDNNINVDNAYFNFRKLLYAEKEVEHIDHYGNKIEFEGEININEELKSYMTTFKENSIININKDSIINTSTIDGKFNSKSNIYLTSGTNVGKNANIKAEGDIYINKLYMFSDITSSQDNNINISGNLKSNNIIINDISKKPENITVNKASGVPYGIYDLQECMPLEQPFVTKDDYIKLVKTQKITIKDANLTADKINIIDTLIEGTNNIIKANETILQSGKDKEIT
ncbi:hypothetical protein, partial [Campylobacter sp. MG1]|uniref:hypothetical protein n=1 Tax=Campylobacter sp. MG1 TaxID=2976332 RepID=UPI00226CDE1B